jgi:hypothetical protein
MNEISEIYGINDLFSLIPSSHSSQFRQLLNSEQNPEECDATKADSSTAAG